jgi:hypothetical protein
MRSTDTRIGLPDSGRSSCCAWRRFSARSSATRNSSRMSIASSVVHSHAAFRTKSSLWTTLSGSSFCLSSMRNGTRSGGRKEVETILEPRRAG